MTESDLKFLKALKRNNNREWFQKHKAEADTAQKNFLDLVGGLADAIAQHRRNRQQRLVFEHHAEHGHRHRRDRQQPADPVHQRAAHHHPQRQRHHHKHHRYIDTPRDPYNITQGFWHAHMGWLLREREYDHASPLGVEYGKDPLVRFQHNHYYSLAIFFAFVLPAGIAALWGDAFGGFILAGLGVVVINHQFTFSINSFAHWLGRQPYSDKHTARDSHFLAFFNYGEGYHNYHHEFPNDYRNGIRWFQWDPTKWLIRTLSFVGLARNLKSVPAEIIVKRRIAMQQKRMQSVVSHRVPMDEAMDAFALAEQGSALKVVVTA